MNKAHQQRKVKIRNTIMEKFSLKWNDFTSNVQKSFQNLRREEDFFDVTLVGDDSTLVTAHKLVLASSSEYFKNIFLKNKKHFQSHALICLECLNQSDLNNILDYIYQGEVKIYQEELDRFLGIAERLKLEGLIGGEEPEVEDRSQSLLEEKPETHQTDFLLATTTSFEPKKVREVRIKGKPDIEFHSSEFQSLEELDNKIEDSYTKDTSGNFTCHYCGKSFYKNAHIKEHVESHISGLSFPCTFCDSILRSRCTLRQHIQKKHNS